jgi:co-chaperonin GroES (HSP10)
MSETIPAETDQKVRLHSKHLTPLWNWVLILEHPPASMEGNLFLAESNKRDYGTILAVGQGVPMPEHDAPSLPLNEMFKRGEVVMVIDWEGYPCDALHEDARWIHASKILAKVDPGVIEPRFEGSKTQAELERDIALEKKAEAFRRQVLS